MSRIKWILLGLVIGAGLSYGAAKNYLLYTNHGFEIVPKANLSFGNSYLDTRGFGITDWSANPELVKDITVSGKQHILFGAEPSKAAATNPATMLKSQ